MSKKSSSEISVSTKKFSDSELTLLDTVYRMVGLREYGLTFDATKVPLSTMKALTNQFVKYQVEAEASQEDRDASKALLGKL